MCSRIKRAKGRDKWAKKSPALFPGSKIADPEAPAEPIPLGPKASTLDPDMYDAFTM